MKPAIELLARQGEHTRADDVSEPLAAREAGIKAMPPGNVRFAEEIAEVDNFALAFVAEIDEAAFRVFDFDGQAIKDCCRLAEGCRELFSAIGGMLGVERRS